MNKIFSLLIVLIKCILIIATAADLVIAGQTGSISGTVLDGSDLPLQNVTVTISSYTGSYNATGTTDLSGNYSFPTLSSDLYTIQFVKTGYLSRWNGGATSQSIALPIILNAPDALTNINAKLLLGGSISGTVIDATGTPITGANVYASRFIGGVPTYFVSSGTAGNYTISGMESGTYYIKFSAVNYQAVWYGGVLNKISSTTVAVTAPIITTAINGQLGLGGTISGTITDSALNPLPNVSVNLHGPTTWEFDSTYTTSDASGNYTFKGIGNGTYYVQAAYSAWYGGATIKTALPITIVSPTDVFSGINIALDTGLGKISGTVVDVNDIPIPNASLTLYASTGTSISYVSGGNTSSDSNGNFSFSNLKSGDYYINCFSMGTPETWYGGVLTQQAAMAIPVTSPKTVSDINIKMGVGSRISGTVTDASGFPLLGVNVTLYDSSGNGLVGGGATTDDTGNYIFRGFPAGTYYIQFYPPSPSNSPPVWYGGAISQKFATPVVITGPTPVTGINIQLGVGARISGTVRGPLNIPIQGATAAIFDQSGARFYNVNTDATGAYQFIGIPAGMYFIVFSKTGLYSSWYGNASSQQAATPIIMTSSSVVAGINGLLTLGGRISGTVLDVTNAPVSSVNVSLYRTDGSSLSYNSTDTSGNYSLAGIADGQYFVSFMAIGSQKVWYGGSASMLTSAPVTISGSNYVTGVDAQLGSGGSISGTITNGSPFMNVHLFDAAGNLVANTRPVDSTGYYFFTGLQTSTYYIQVTTFINYGAIWYGGLTFQTATPIQVTAPQAVNNIDLAYDATGINWIDSFVPNNGTITGSPAGVMCSKEITSGCSAAYHSTETVTLTATPDSDSYFVGWGADCQGTSQTCDVQMNTSHFVSAMFLPAPKAKISDRGYLTLNFAYTAAGSTATIQTLDSVLNENLVFSDNKNITIQGGYNSQYTAKSGIPTILSGSLIIRNGRLTVDQLKIKPQ